MVHYQKLYLQEVKKSPYFTNFGKRSADIFDNLVEKAGPFGKHYGPVHSLFSQKLLPPTNR